MRKFKEFLEDQLQDKKTRLLYEEIGKDVEIGIQLAERREELGLTQEQLAAMTGLKQPMIARIERGQRATLWTLRKFANALSSRIIIDGEKVMVDPVVVVRSEWKATQYPVKTEGVQCMEAA